MKPRERRKGWARFSSEQDELIARYYGTRRTPVIDLMKLPEFQGYTKGSVQFRAAKLGVNRPRILFTEEEKKIITAHAGERSVHAIVRLIERKTGRTRNYNAVFAFIRVHLQCSARPDRYSVQDLKIAFRVSRESILKWVRLKMLVGERDMNQMGSDWRFSPLEVARFIARHPFELEGRTVDVPWIVSLIMEFSSRLNPRSPTNNKKEE